METHHYLGFAFTKSTGKKCGRSGVFLGGRGRGAVVGGQASWDDAKTAFEAVLGDAFCEGQRASSGGIGLRQGRG